MFQTSIRTRRTCPCSAASTLRTGLLALAGLAVAGSPALAQSFLPTGTNVHSVMPANGDQNPYGVVVVPPGFNTTGSTLAVGDILVSNFNNNNNLAGTGTTVMSVPPKGPATQFFALSNPVLGASNTGYSMALGILKAGYVIVGCLPSTDGMPDTAKVGSFLVINQKGVIVQHIVDANIHGPWGMAVVDNGTSASIFFSNVLNGTVYRLDVAVGSAGLTVEQWTLIGTGYSHLASNAIFEAGPSGLVFDSLDNTLYVASQVDDSIYAIPGALTATSAQGKGTLVFTSNTYLHGPQGLAQAPNGDILIANSDSINASATAPSELTEITTEGTFVKQLSIDPTDGGAFGLAVKVAPDGLSAVLAAVDDVSVTLKQYTVPLL